MKNLVWYMVEVKMSHSCPPQRRSWWRGCCRCAPRLQRAFPQTTKHLQPETSRCGGKCRLLISGRTRHTWSLSTRFDQKKWQVHTIAHNDKRVEQYMKRSTFLTCTVTVMFLILRVLHDVWETCWTCRVNRTSCCLRPQRSRWNPVLSGWSI